MAVAVRVALLLATHPYDAPIGYEMTRIAVAIATRGEYADPFATMRTGPTAHYPPVYPLFLAGIYTLFGTGRLGLIVSYSINLLFGSGQFALLPWFAAVLRLPLKWGVVGGILGAIVPFNFLSEIKAGESLAGLVFLLMTILTVTVINKEQFSFARGLWHGLLWGISTLLLNSALALLGALLLACVWYYRRMPYFLVRYGVAIACGIAITIIPWAVRNEHALHSPVILQSRVGTELDAAYSDLATPDIYAMEADGAWARVHPNESPVKAQQVRDLGEVEFNRRELAEAESWISSHPVKAVQLTLCHVLLFWFPLTPRLLQTVFFCSLTLAAFCGIPTVWRANRLAGMVLVTVYVVSPIPYWIIVSTARHRLQIQWAFLLSAGCLICTAWHRLSLLRGVRSQPADGE